MERVHHTYLIYSLKKDCCRFDDQLCYQPYSKTSVPSIELIEKGAGIDDVPWEQKNAPILVCTKYGGCLFMYQIRLTSEAGYQITRPYPTICKYSRQLYLP